MLGRLGEVQLALRAHRLDGWLFYDFRGQNPVATHALGLDDHVLSRRFFYWLPAEGIPVLIAHATEIDSFPPLPGERIRYTSWTSLCEVLASILPTRARVAMEYSPMGGNPHLSRVDGGTLELVRSYGTTVVPSEPLVQELMCRWDASDLESHRRAAEAAGRICEEALDWLGARLAAGEYPNEVALQELLCTKLEAVGLGSDAPPIVAAGPHTADPHYRATPAGARTIARGDALLIELSVREREPSGVFAELCWMAHVGADVPARMTEAFTVVARARDRAVALVRERFEQGRRVLGLEVDRAARDEVARAGMAEHFVHRTGHHLGRTLYSGYGCTLDDFEVHDTRELLPGLAWAVHPGLYFEDLGVRTGISLYLDADEGPRIHTPVQNEITPLYLRDVSG